MEWLESYRAVEEVTLALEVGLTTNSPSSLPTLTVAIGPLNGMSEIISAAEAPTPANVSAIFSPSLDITVIMTCVSFLNDFGKSGLIGLSVRRLVKISICHGVTEALQIIFAAYLSDGDEVLAPGPHYPPYMAYPQVYGGKTVEYRFINQQLHHCLQFL